MVKFKTKNIIELFSLAAIELNIIPSVYGILNNDNETLHIIEGEFKYCDLLIDAKIIVTEKQLNEILNIQNISVHKIVNSVIYIHSLSPENCKKFNALKREAQYISTENIEDEIEVFKLI
jgi:hypothetical protein